MKDVYTIIENDHLEKSIWLRIGAAFENRDDSLTVFLDCLPINGRLHIRERNNRDPQKKSDEDPAR